MDKDDLFKVTMVVKDREVTNRTNSESLSILREFVQKGEVGSYVKLQTGNRKPIRLEWVLEGVSKTPVLKPVA